MANRRKGLKMINEIMRLKEKGLGKEKIAKALGISKNTVKKYLRQGREENSQKIKTESSRSWSKYIDWPEVESAVNRGVALSVWWEENLKPIREGDLAGISYISLWREWREKFPKIDLSFHKYHQPGESCEIDFKGDAAGLGYVDRRSGEFITCRLFGSILCFSQLFFARASHSEKKQDLFISTAKSFEYFSGVTNCLRFDNAKTAVTRADWYDPEIDKEFGQFCEHFGVVFLPCRPGRPKDKNLIEGALGVFWRWAGPKIRERTFFSLEELNDFLRELCRTFNHRIQKKSGLSRFQKFNDGEKAKLSSLPETSFEYAAWKKAKVHPDCHVQISFNFYSVPHQLRGKTLDVRITTSFLEIFNGLERVAIHKLQSSSQRGRYVTDTNHLPDVHKALLESTPQKAMDDAREIGPETYKLIRRLIEGAKHPFLYLRRAQGIIRLRCRYPCEQIEGASTLVNSLDQSFPRFRDFENLVKNLIFQSELRSTTKVVRQENPNLRGQNYWSDQNNIN
jgi:transposase